jgi:hypothetical protein
MDQRVMFVSTAFNATALVWFVPAVPDIVSPSETMIAALGLSNDRVPIWQWQELELLTVR